MRLINQTIPDFKSVACGIFLPVGSSTEPKKLAGISHFMEHLVFKGSKRFNSDSIANSIDATGGSVNAYTSVELTAFYFKVLRDDVSSILDIFLDIVFSPKLDESDINREKGVVLSEIASMLDDPDDLSHNGIFEVCWDGHPAARPVLGYSDVIENLSTTAIAQFHNGNYLQSDAVISFCGGMTEDEIIELLSSKGVEAETSIPQIQSEEISRPAFGTGTYAKEFDSEQVYFNYSWRGLDLDSEDIEKTLVAEAILSGSYSSRLFRRLREQEGLVYSISGLSHMFTFGGLMGIHGSVPKGKYRKMDAILCEELDSFRSTGVTHEELDRSKRMIRGSVAISLEGNMASMHRNGKLALLLGSVKSLDTLLDRIDAIDFDEMNDYIRTLIPDEYSVSVVGKDIERTTGIPVGCRRRT